MNFEFSFTLPNLREPTLTDVGSLHFIPSVDRSGCRPERSTEGMKINFIMCISGLQMTVKSKWGSGLDILYTTIRI